MRERLENQFLNMAGYLKGMEIIEENRPKDDDDPEAGLEEKLKAELADLKKEMKRHGT